MGNTQPGEDPSANGSPRDTRERTDNHCAQQRVRWAMQDRLIRKDANEWLDVHKDLGAPKDHEAEVSTADCLEGCSGAEMEWREGHCWLIQRMS